MTELPVLTAPDGPRQTTSLRARRTPLASPEKQLGVLETLDLPDSLAGTGDFKSDLVSAGWDDGLHPSTLEIFQINVGKLCNMTCTHCHVDAGPDRVEENMNRETIDACLRAIDKSGAHTVDITGGAPELSPHFNYLVDACVDRGLHVIDRCNLTILVTNRYKHLPQWLSERGVEVACSLPHYRKLGTDAQRGDGTYDKSIEALKQLNAVGYGTGHPEKMLTLVTNPVGAFLAGNQASLEREWKEALERNHGVSFDRLFALNNIPISRYLEWLLEKNQLQEYMERLVHAFNPATIDGLMCRNTISVSWDGRLFDCDFNQMLEIEADVPGMERPHVRDFSLESWQHRQIQTARHCYGCTAGEGSSCGGATT